MKVFIPHYSDQVEKRVLKEKATMEKPARYWYFTKYNGPSGFKQSKLWVDKCRSYQQHLTSLQTIPMPNMTPEFGKREEVVEGRDFELQHQMEYQRHPDEPYRWIDISHQEYKNVKEHSTCRIIAIAIEGKPDRERGVTISTGGSLPPFKITIDDGFCAWEYGFDTDSDISIYDIVNTLCKEFAGSVRSKSCIRKFTPSTTQSVEQPVGEQGATEQENAFLRRCLDLYRRTGGNVTVTPTAPASSVEQRAKEEIKAFIDLHEEWEAGIIGDNKCWGGDGLAGWPTIRAEHYDKFIEVQTARNKAKAAIAGHSSQQPGDAVTLTREQVEGMIQHWEKEGYENYLREHGYSSDPYQDKDEYINSLFKQRGK